MDTVQVQIPINYAVVCLYPGLELEVLRLLLLLQYNELALSHDLTFSFIGVVCEIGKLIDWLIALDLYLNDDLDGPLFLGDKIR